MTRHCTPANAPRNEAHFSPFSPKEQHKGLALCLDQAISNRGFAYSDLADLTRLCASLGVTLEIR